LLATRVSGNNREPAPPASMMPFIAASIGLNGEDGKRYMVAPYIVTPLCTVVAIMV